MTLAAFQSALAELVAEARDGSGRDDLAAVERQRLAALADDRGVATMRMLYMSWRLTKVLSLLPLSLRVLGDERTAALLRAFWAIRKATSLHFVEECLEFAAFLHARVQDKPQHFAAILDFETARLQLRMQQSLGLRPAAQRVVFDAEPAALFAAVQGGSDLSSVPPCDAVLRGELDADGRERWTIEGGGSVLEAPSGTATSAAY